MVQSFSSILFCLSDCSMETVIINIQSEEDIRKIRNHENYESNVKGAVSKAKPQKMKLTIPKIPSTSYSKTKNQTTTMIRKDL